MLLVLCLFCLECFVEGFPLSNIFSKHWFMLFVVNFLVILFCPSCFIVVFRFFLMWQVSLSTWRPVDMGG